MDPIQAIAARQVSPVRKSDAEEVEAFYNAHAFAGLHDARCALKHLVELLRDARSRLGDKAPTAPKFQEQVGCNMVAQPSKVMPMPDTLYSADDCEAVAEVIHRETACFRNLDFDGWAACYLQSPRACTVSASPGLGVTVLRGWNAIRDDMASALALGSTPCGMSDFRKHNMQITIDGDIAWAIYDGWTQADDGSEANSIETVILERAATRAPR